MKAKLLSLTLLLSCFSYTNAGQAATTPTAGHQDQDMTWFFSNADSYLLMSLGLIGLGIARKKQR